jgi:hypothetical protein
MAVRFREFPDFYYDLLAIKILELDVDLLSRFFS